LITHVGDYLGDNCQRPQATRSDMRLVYRQLERVMQVLHHWSDSPLTSLIRKRSLV